MVNVMKGGGRAPPPSPAWANFTLMMEYTPESSRYCSVYFEVFKDIYFLDPSSSRDKARLSAWYNTSWRTISHKAFADFPHQIIIDISHYINKMQKETIGILNCRHSSFMEATKCVKVSLLHLIERYLYLIP
jgi:hypothetical protein